MPATASPSVPPAPTPSPTLAITGLIVDTADGFRITLPEGWDRVDLQGFPLAARRTVNEDPTFPTNLNIQRAASNGLDLDTIDSLLLTQAKSFAYKHKVIDSRINLPGGEAICYSYRAQIGNLFLNARQYVLVTQETEFVITFGASLSDKYLSDEAITIMESFKPLS